MGLQWAKSVLYCELWFKVQREAGRAATTLLEILSSLAPQYTRSSITTTHCRKGEFLGRVSALKLILPKLERTVT